MSRVKKKPPAVQPKKETHERTKRVTMMCFPFVSVVITTPPRETTPTKEKIGSQRPQSKETTPSKEKEGGPLVSFVMNARCLILPSKE